MWWYVSLIQKPQYIHGSLEVLFVVFNDTTWRWCIADGHCYCVGSSRQGYWACLRRLVVNWWVRPCHIASARRFDGANLCHALTVSEDGCLWPWIKLSGRSILVLGGIGNDAIYRVCVCISRECSSCGRKSPPKQLLETPDFNKDRTCLL